MKREVAPGKPADNGCRSLAPFAKPFVQIFIEFVKGTSRGGVAPCGAATKGNWEMIMPRRLHDAVTSVANDIMKYRVMAGRKWLPCNAPVFLCTSVKRVISFKNTASHESAPRNIPAPKCQPDRIAFHHCRLPMGLARFSRTLLCRSRNS